MHITHSPMDSLKYWDSLNRRRSKSTTCINYVHQLRQTPSDDRGCPLLGVAKRNDRRRLSFLYYSTCLLYSAVSCHLLANQELSS